MNDIVQFHTASDEFFIRNDLTFRLKESPLAFYIQAKMSPAAPLDLKGFLYGFFDIIKLCFCSFK